MSLLTEPQVQHALDCLTKDYSGAKARAAAEYLDDYTKVLLAELMDQSNESSAAAKEAWARRQESYKDHLIQLRDAREMDYKYRKRDAASMAILDLYRTESANNRGAERLR